MSKATKSQQASRVKQLITGANKHFPDASQKLTIGGAAYTVTALTALLQSFVDLRDTVDVSRAAAQAKIAAESVQAPPLLGVVSAFVAYVKATFGNSPDTLADFGLSPRKAARPLSAEQTAAAVAKRAATRAARHTVGKVQKKAIKGSVKVTVTSTPLAAPQPVAAPSAPIGNAPSGGSTPHA